MKYVRFELQGATSYGILSDDRIQVLQGDLFNQPVVTGRIVGLSDVRLMAPCSPSKAVCIGLNYRDHAEEMKHELPKEPLFFLKPSSSLNGPEGEIRYPAISQNVHHEAELAVVIGKTAKHVKAGQAYELFLGIPAPTM